MYYYTYHILCCSLLDQAFNIHSLSHHPPSLSSSHPPPSHVSLSPCTVAHRGSWKGDRFPRYLVCKHIAHTTIHVHVHVHVYLLPSPNVQDAHAHCFTCICTCRCVECCVNGHHINRLPVRVEAVPLSLTLSTHTLTLTQPRMATPMAGTCYACTCTMSMYMYMCIHSLV